MSNKTEIEESLTFSPKFDTNGLIPCIATCEQSGDVLIFAYMNKAALQKTIESGEAHYYSRSRNELWHKGATSGMIQRVTQMRTDCDQDCIWIKIKPIASCHTGRKSCFYREITPNNQLKLIDAEREFDPDKVYR